MATPAMLMLEYHPEIPNTYPDPIPRFPHSPRIIMMQNTGNSLMHPEPVYVYTFDLHPQKYTPPVSYPLCTRIDCGIHLDVDDEFNADTREIVITPKKEIDPVIMDILTKGRHAGIYNQLRLQ